MQNAFVLDIVSLIVGLSETWEEKSFEISVFVMERDMFSFFFGFSGIFEILYMSELT